MPIEPKKDRKFSFLSEDELRKMKEEEAARIASMTRYDRFIDSMNIRMMDNKNLDRQNFD